jgi:D-psicose/D-tagatose/L-ribulose 3-epimerase
MLTLSISNIAWNRESDEEVGQFLKDRGVSNIEIAPTKYLPGAPRCSDKEVLEIKKIWNSHGISISSMQSIFFGHENLQLVEEGQSHELLRMFFLEWGRIGHLLGSGVMVLGGPKNRLLGRRHLQAAIEAFHKFIIRLEAEWIWNHKIAFESNPSEYGCEFVTTTSESIKLVEGINSPILGWNLDTACTVLGGEDPLLVLNSGKGLPMHVHLSAPNLAPLNHSLLEINKAVVKELSLLHYKGFVTLEMRPSQRIQDLYESVDLFCEYFA